MWPFKRNKFQWPNGFSNKPCICECGHELEDNEVTFIWESWCKVKCVKCGRRKMWHSKYNYI